MSVTKIRIKINDIYTWGTGFKPGIRAIWDRYFGTLNNPCWRVLKDDYAIFLVGVYCGAMVHPYDGFTVYLNSDNVNDYTIESLKSIFTGLAEQCHTSCDFYLEHFS